MVALRAEEVLVVALTLSVLLCWVNVNQEAVVVAFQLDTLVVTVTVCALGEDAIKLSDAELTDM
jgi:hypothetical protein